MPVVGKYWDLHGFFKGLITIRRARLARLSNLTSPVFLNLLRSPLSSLGVPLWYSTEISSTAMGNARQVESCGGVILGSP
jgi:hypothetical protein